MNQTLVRLVLGHFACTQTAKNRWRPPLLTLDHPGYKFYGLRPDGTRISVYNVGDMLCTVDFVGDEGLKRRR